MLKMCGRGRKHWDILGADRAWRRTEGKLFDKAVALVNVYAYAQGL